MTSKEVYRRIYAHQSCEHFPSPDDMISVYMPGEHYMPQPGQGKIGQDWFGTYWAAMADELGGDTVVPGNYRLNEISEWREKDVIPSAQKFRAFDWEEYFRNCCGDKDYNTTFVRVVMVCGFFERLHMLLGFENAMCGLYDSPEDVKDFVRAMVDFKKMEVDYVMKYFHPDVISFHDDYGMERQLFMKPSMWHEFFEPAVNEIVSYMHSKGATVQFHSCGYIMDVIGPLVDSGVDAVEIQDVNDLKKIKELYGERIVIVSGIDYDRQKSQGKTDAEIRETARALYVDLIKENGFLPKFLIDVAEELLAESRQNSK